MDQADHTAEPSSSASSPSDSALRLRLRFPRAARLQTAGEFRRVKEQGRTWGGRHLVLGVLENAPDGLCRIGLITSRRVGGAVERVRVRRLFREAIRPCRPQLRAGCWVVIIARHPAAKATLAELTADWLRLARRASILPTPPKAGTPL